jgi:hypothetical protein
MKGTLWASVLVLIALVSCGCLNAGSSSPDPQPSPYTDSKGQQSGPPPIQPAPLPVVQSQEALGGLRLGMTEAEVTKILGEQYQERSEPDPGGAFREPFSVRSYTGGCEVVLGHTTGRVLQIEVIVPGYPTNLGVMVGDKSLAALQTYRSRYPEWIGNQSPDMLPGWFETEPGVLLIFSSQANRERSNHNLTDRSIIYSITLGYARYFD